MVNNLSSTFFNDLVLNYQSVHTLTPAYTIKISPTKWLAISTGLSSNREPVSGINRLVILDNMTFYNIELLSTIEPIDEFTYREIYCNFKGKPMYNWGNVPKDISPAVLMGCWGICDTVITEEQVLERVF
mgnify:CR=1 FL=1